MLSSKKAHLLSIVILSSAILPAGRSRADVGVQAGPRTGLEFDEGEDVSIGADVRLSFPLSPLTVNLTFDYYFIEDQTLFQFGANTLYDLPIALRRLSPYVGAGLGVTSFSSDEDADVGDSHGTRFGLNLIGGVRFELPVLRPFAQAMVSIGDIDLFTIGGGFLFGFGGG